MNGKATSLPKPAYPAAARAVKASGTVSIQVIVDESGNIVSTSAVSGHPLLRAAAEQAAKGAKFSPTMMSGQPVKVTGVITYNFVNPNDAGNVQIATGELSFESSPQTPATAEMLREQLIKEKLHAWVYALFERTRKNLSEATPNESAFVTDGRAHLEIVLTERTQAVLDRLAAIGFTIVNDDNAKTVTGHIAIDKMRVLAEITEVKLVLPRS
jgi:TonB family protein